MVVPSEGCLRVLKEIRNGPRAKDERVFSQAIRVRGRPHVAIANFIALLEAVRALERNASVASHMLPHYLGTQASY